MVARFHLRCNCFILNKIIQYVAAVLEQVAAAIVLADAF